MNILALDLGTTTGFAVSPSIGALVSGTWDNKGGRYEGGGMRYLRFRRQLDDLHKTLPIEVVYFEEVRRHMGVDAAHVYGGMLAVLSAWGEEHNVPYQGVAIGTWKKWLTGKGNSSKEEVMAAVKALGYQPSGYDEADALAILLMVVSETGKPVPAVST